MQMLQEEERGCFECKDNDFNDCNMFYKMNVDTVYSRSCLRHQCHFLSPPSFSHQFGKLFIWKVFNKQVGHRMPHITYNLVVKTRLRRSNVQAPSSSIRVLQHSALEGLPTATDGGSTVNAAAALSESHFN